MSLSALCLIATSAFHTPDVWVYRAGHVWDMVGSYFLFRIFVRSDEDVCRIFKIVGIVLLPVAALMLLEKYVGQNFFAAFGGVSEVVVRDGHIRARGALRIRSWPEPSARHACLWQSISGTVTAHTH